MAKRRILIVFDTGEGQTEKIARRIAAELGEGLEVALEPASSAPAPDGYDGVVVGGSIHVDHELGADDDGCWDG
jgi:menaquinone-dependent protoporphyrinogen IX oxidase